MNVFCKSFQVLAATALRGWLVAGAAAGSLLAQSGSLPANWQRAGSVTVSPDRPALTTKPGDALLIGGAGQPYVLASTTGDFALSMDVLLTPGADLRLTLPTGAPISLANARLSKAPGLWQSVELRYRGLSWPGPASRGPASRGAAERGPALLERLVLNGVPISEGQALTGAANGNVALAVSNGSVAVRNVVYKPFAARDVVRWNGPLRYTIYEGENGRRADLAGKKILKEGTVPAIDYDVTYGQPRRFSIVYTGELTALTAGEYQFDLHYGGIGGLAIDGQEVLPATYHDLGQPSVAKTKLTAGPHRVEVFFTRSWPRPGLGLFVSQADTRPQALHTLASLPEPDPVGVISVKADARPELIRSFVQLPGETKKRTHSLSVGTPTGMHYTLDLDQMALLQAWKGDFADVTEMWYERGEPQLLRPLGAAVPLAPQSALTVLANDGAAWPDSVDEHTLRYRGLLLGKDGLPTIRYTLAGSDVTDVIRPDGNALVRTLTVTGNPTGTLYCRVAAGSSLEEVSKGLFAVNDRSYYVRLDPKLKVKRRESNGRQELLIPVTLKNGSGSVQYALLF